MTEQQPYEVLAGLPGFELRLYPEHLVARVTVHATLEAARGAAFGYLSGYFGGLNTLRQERAEPGLPDPRGAAAEQLPTLLTVRIPRTAPVLLQPEAPGDACSVAFVLPAFMSAGAVPDPADPAVEVVQVPEGRGAAAVFSGRWTPRSYRDRARVLAEAAAAAGLAPLGPPRLALFGPPYRPWFLRPNEVIQSVE